MQASSPSSSITITDTSIIDFFNESLIDPTKFILMAIQHKHLFLNFMTEKPDDTNPFTEQLRKYKIDFFGFKKSQMTIREKITELSKLIESQRLPFLEQSLNANRMIEKTTYDCPYCNQQTFLTKRALAGHTNKCRPLYEIHEESEEEEKSNDESFITENT